MRELKVAFHLEGRCEKYLTLVLSASGKSCVARAHTPLARWRGGSIKRRDEKSQVISR